MHSVTDRRGRSATAIHRHYLCSSIDICCVTNFLIIITGCTAVPTMLRASVDVVLKHEISTLSPAHIF